MRDVAAAWDAFFKENATVDVETMNADGWRTCEQIAEITGQTDDSARKILSRRRDFEIKKCRIILNGSARSVNFYRPK